VQVLEFEKSFRGKFLVEEAVHDAVVVLVGDSYVVSITVAPEMGIVIHDALCFNPYDFLCVLGGIKTLASTTFSLIFR